MELTQEQIDRLFDTHTSQYTEEDEENISKLHDNHDCMKPDGCAVCNLYTSIYGPEEDYGMLEF